jgi:hypothetical protein
MIIPEHNYTQREQTVCDILKDLKIQSFINVGFHHWEDPRRHWWIKICDVNNVSWKIVEVFESNVLDTIKKGCPEDKIFNLNIKEVDNLPDADCLMFWHGPEHLLKEEFLEILPKLEKKYKKLIFGMPWGEEPQGAAYGNPFEEHVSAWDVEEWEDLGYTVVKVVDRQKYPHITCYKV